MLGKLLKHEWKATWKIPAILLGILLVISFFAGSTFLAPLFDRHEMNGLELLAVLIWMMYYFAIIGVSMGVTLYLAIHFYKTMFTDEGYLTHTLPVTSHELLISKILPIMAWQVLSTLAIFVSVAIFGGMAVIATNEGLTFRDVYRQLIAFLTEEGLFGNMGLLGFIGSLFLLFVAGTISGTMMIVSSVSVGQMVSKHKVLGSIGAYFAINSVMQIVYSIVYMPIMMTNLKNGSPESVFDILTPAYIGMSVIAILISVGLYFLSAYLIHRKLNLD